MLKSSSDRANAAWLPTIAITMGDAAGIGPEIIAKALSGPLCSPRFRPVLIGDFSILQAAFQRWSDLGLRQVEAPDLNSASEDAIQVWNPAEMAADEEQRLPEAAYIRHAARACLGSKFDAMVTAPICKESMYARGFRFPGHTEYLAHVTESAHPVMAFTAPGLKVSLVTVHLPLCEVPRILTAELVHRTVHLSAQGLQEYFGIGTPRLALCGLNPHAGENGHLGKEEQEILVPALKACQAVGLQVEGPFPADTVFAQAIRGRFDLVVAMYHDQGLIPVKLLSFGESVNLTLGLPIVRTSVDHGVAYDIAGKGIADASSMIAAIRLAVEIVDHRRSGHSDPIQ